MPVSSGNSQNKMCVHVCVCVQGGGINSPNISKRNDSMYLCMYSVIFVCEYYFENVPESKMNGLVRIVLTVLSRLSFQSEKKIL